MAPQVTYELLRSVFAEDEVLRFPEASLPASLTHAPSRAYLTTVGLPAVGNWLFLPPVWKADEPLKTVGAVDPYLDDMVDLPEDAPDWTVVGQVADDVLALDGATGRLWFFPNGEDEITPCFDRIETLGLFLYVLQREKVALYGPEDGEDDGLDPHEEIDRVREELRAIEPAAFADPEGTWARLLQGFEDEWTDFSVEEPAPLGDGEFWVPPHLR
ncbi:SUKH-4 family immunity protein [Kitasatospora sp. NPDC001540]|uniref:SUKH-4 family immunity protein n=1 Tax=Kitasatospora sp. NPDC001540 TaxID=3364014 RepID=UPI0036C99063